MNENFRATRNSDCGAGWQPAADCESAAASFKDSLAKPNYVSSRRSKMCFYLCFRYRTAPRALSPARIVEIHCQTSESDALAHWRAIPAGRMPRSTARKQDWWQLRNFPWIKRQADSQSAAGCQPALQRNLRSERPFAPLTDSRKSSCRPTSRPDAAPPRPPDRTDAAAFHPPKPHTSGGTSPALDKTVVADEHLRRVGRIRSVFQIVPASIQNQRGPVGVKENPRHLVVRIVDDQLSRAAPGSAPAPADTIRDRDRTRSARAAPPEKTAPS